MPDAAATHRSVPERLLIPTAGDRTRTLTVDVHGTDGPTVVVNPAMAVPGRFYHRFAEHLVGRGFTAVTWDYRDIAASRDGSLAGSNTSALDWADDIASVVDWASRRSEPVHLVGHSLGGQLAGTLPRPEQVTSMVAIVAQSAYWKYQGGTQKAAVLFNSHVTLPLLSLLPYTPFRLIGFGEDIPSPAARQWARWTRHPDYLMGDPAVPTDRYALFTAPILSYSIDDDDWGTPAAVDAMMSHYPNVVRRHLVPAEYGMAEIGHMGAFRSGAERIWDEIADWLDKHQ